MRSRVAFRPYRRFLLCLFITISCLCNPNSFGEKKPWEAGTILDVKAHQARPEHHNAAKQYDISIKVGKKVYVVRYDAEPNQPDPEHYIGMQRTVFIEGDTLKINDLQGRTRLLQIVSSKDAAPFNSK